VLGWLSTAYQRTALIGGTTSRYPQEPATICPTSLRHAFRCNGRVRRSFYSPSGAWRSTTNGSALIIPQYSLATNRRQSRGLFFMCHQAADREDRECLRGGNGGRSSLSGRVVAYCCYPSPWTHWDRLNFRATSSLGLADVGVFDLAQFVVG